MPSTSNPATRKKPNDRTAAIRSKSFIQVLQAYPTHSVSHSKRRQAVRASKLASRSQQTALLPTPFSEAES
jgi:hypothetical protein